MKVARLVTKTAILGLAAYGAQQAWNRYTRPALDAVEQQVAPAVRDAASSVRDAAAGGSGHITREDVASVHVPPGPGQTADDSWLSAAAAKELGLDAEGHEPDSLRESDSASGSTATSGTNH